MILVIKIKKYLIDPSFFNIILLKVKKLELIKEY